MSTSERNILAGCPRCGQPVTVTRIHCSGCRITTELPEQNDCLPRLAMLPEKDQYFLQLFLETEGNIRAVAEAMGKSMPTIKKRLESIKQFLR